MGTALAGSIRYRIEATSIKPVPGVSEKIGFEFTIGKDGDDNKSQEQIEQLNNTVQKLTQTLQTASLSNAEGSPGKGPGLGDGLGAGTGRAASSAAVSAPGAPPNDNISKKTDDYKNLSVPPKVEKIDPQLFSSETSKVSNIKPASNNNWGENSARSFLAEKPLAVKLLDGTNSTAIPSAGSDVIANDLLLQGVLNAQKVNFTLIGNSNQLPPNFKLNGQSISTTSAVSFDATGTTVMRFNLTWNAVSDDSSVSFKSFQIKAEYFDLKGISLGYQSLSFNYGDFKTLADTSGVNQFYLSAKGLSYDIEGNASANTIHAGYGHDIVRGLGGNDKLFGEQGDDTLIGGTGADTLDGGTGNNTASYEGSKGLVNIYLDETNPNSGNDADSDKLINIQNIIGYLDHLVDSSEGYFDIYMTQWEGISGSGKHSVTVTVVFTRSIPGSSVNTLIKSGTINGRTWSVQLSATDFGDLDKNGAFGPVTMEVFQTDLAGNSSDHASTQFTYADQPLTTPALTAITGLVFNPAYTNDNVINLADINSNGGALTISGNLGLGVTTKTPNQRVHLVLKMANMLAKDYYIDYDAIQSNGTWSKTLTAQEVRDLGQGFGTLEVSTQQYE